MVIFAVLIVGNAYRLQDKLNADDPVEFLWQTGVLALFLLAVCWKTGEKPRWQWGIPKKKQRNDELDS